jgi:hypothetical protein
MGKEEEDVGEKNKIKKQKKTKKKELRKKNSKKKKKGFVGLLMTSINTDQLIPSADLVHVCCKHLMVFLHTLMGRRG